MEIVWGWCCTGTCPVPLLNITNKIKLLFYYSSIIHLKRRGIIFPLWEEFQVLGKKERKEISNEILNKVVLEPRVSPAFAITYFCNHCNIRFENTSKYVDTLTLFPKTWTKGHWPLDDLWPHVCWGHMCDSTQGSLCPSPMTIHQCMWIQWSILQNTTYIHIHTYYILQTTYRMSDHIVSYWTQFRRDKNWKVKKKKIVGKDLWGFCIWRGKNPSLHICGRGFVGKGTM